MHAVPVAFYSLYNVKFPSFVLRSIKHMLDVVHVTGAYRALQQLHIWRGKVKLQRERERTTQRRGEIPSCIC